MNVPSPLEAIFFAALEKGSPEACAAYLDQACAGDPGLRLRLGKMLAAQAKAGSFLEQPARSPVATIEEQPFTECPGTVIGPYKLMEQIGEGGMGLVFVAEQQQPVRRKVALKVIKPGMDTRQVVARFEAERQVLALMDHPNIAKVLDGGATANGRPYFVMELVKGVPITQFCDDSRLTPRERLELFLQVCQAVQHAHLKGIIHRDIKPSNVLVMSHDGTPVVRVIDFGVAKALGKQLTDKTVYTQFAQMIGTPMYMSPEQAGESSLDIDTRSDIYSLGVLLYELLTGTTPFDKERLSQVGYDEIRRIIREEEPPKPSTRVNTLGQAATTVSTQRKSDPRRLNQLLRGELDWIVMKALEKDRNRRYETASAFAADVQRYLKDEPVLACPPSAWYRFRKFTRRKKAPLAMAACVFLALAGIAGGIGWAVRDRAAQEEERLAREDALDQAVERTLDETGPLIQQGKWPEALAVVERADKLLAAAGRLEPPLRLLNLQQDLMMALRLDEIYRVPQLYRKYTPKLVIGEGIDAEEEFFQGREQDAYFAREFREYGIGIANSNAADCAARIRGTRIRQALVKALDDWAAIRRNIRGVGDPSWKELVEIARVVDPDVWRNRFREALLKNDRQDLEKLADRIPVRDVSPATLQLLGHLLKELGALDKAMTVLRQAQRQYPDNLWINNTLGWFNLTAFNPPRYDDALRFYMIGSALRPQWARGYWAIGEVLRRKGALDEAIHVLTRTIELDPKDFQARLDRGYTYHLLRQYPAAVSDYKKIIEMDPKHALAYNRLGLALHAQGKWDEAIDCYQKIIKLDPKLLYAHYNLGNALKEKKKFDEAIASYQKAIDLDAKHPWPHNNIGIALGEQGKLAEAITSFRKAIDLDPKYAQAHGNLGNTLRLQKKFHEAIACYQKAIDLDLSARPLCGMGSVLIDLKKWDEAIAWCQKAIALEPKFAPAHYNLGVALHNQGKDAEAFACFQKAVELDPKDAVAHNGLGNCLSEYKHDYDGAIAEFQKAIALDQNYATAQYGLGRALTLKGDPERGITAFRKAIEIDPKHANAHYSLGVVLYAKKDLDAAITEYRNALKIDPKHTQAHNNLGSALGKQGKLDEAVAAYQKAIEFDPNHAHAHFNLGLVLAKQKKMDDAIACYRRVIEIDPKYPRAQYCLGAALFKKNKLDEAVDCFRKAIEIDPRYAPGHCDLGTP